MNIELPFPLSWFLAAHILGGAIALATFALPLFSAKGGKTHVRTGWVYSAAMFTVAVTTFVITPWRYFFDSNGTEKTKLFSVFLFFIAVLSLATLQQGLYVLKQKKREKPNKTLKARGLPVALLVVAVAIVVMGAILQKILFVIFGVIGIRTAQKQITFWTQGTSSPYSWWFYHLENMFTCCIGTVTAFVVTAVPRIYPQFDSVYVWIAPTVIMTPWMIWFIRKYQRKFSLVSRP